MTMLDILTVNAFIVLAILFTGSVAHYIYLEHEYRKWRKQHDDNLRDL